MLRNRLWWLGLHEVIVWRWGKPDWSWASEKFAKKFGRRDRTKGKKSFRFPPKCEILHASKFRLCARIHTFQPSRKMRIPLLKCAVIKIVWEVWLKISTFLAKLFSKVSSVMQSRNRKQRGGLPGNNFEENNFWSIARRGRGTRKRSKQGFLAEFHE